MGRKDSRGKEEEEEEEKEKREKKNRMINDCSKIIKPFDRTLPAIHPPSSSTSRFDRFLDHPLPPLMKLTFRNRRKQPPPYPSPLLDPLLDRATHRREIGFRLRLPD